jgi:hypothetical protein
MRWKRLDQSLKSVSKKKMYVLYEWTGGTILRNAALHILLSNQFQTCEIAGALKG